MPKKRACGSRIYDRPGLLRQYQVRWERGPGGVREGSGWGMEMGGAGLLHQRDCICNIRYSLAYAGIHGEGVEGIVQRGSRS